MVACRTDTSTFALGVGAVVDVGVHVANDIGEVDGARVDAVLAVVGNQSCGIVSTITSRLAVGVSCNVVFNTTRADSTPRNGVTGGVARTNLNKTTVGEESVALDDLNIPEVRFRMSVRRIVRCSSDVVGEMHNTKDEIKFEVVDHGKFVIESVTTRIATISEAEEDVVVVDTDDGADDLDAGTVCVQVITHSVGEAVDGALDDSCVPTNDRAVVHGRGVGSRSRSNRRIHVGVAVDTDIIVVSASSGDTIIDHVLEGATAKIVGVVAVDIPHDNGA